MSHLFLVRSVATMAVLFSAAAARTAYADPPWDSDEAAAVKLAQKQGRPICFWFATDERPGYRRDHNALDDAREAIRKAFRDPETESAYKPFVMVFADPKIERGLLKELKGKALEVVLTTDDGTVLQRLLAKDARDAKKLAAALRDSAAKHREIIYTKSVRPILRDDTAKPEALTKALRRAEELDVAAADADVIALLARSGVAEGVRAKCFELLAQLSTPAAAEELLKQSVDDPRAEQALRKCKPEAADVFAAHLDGDPTPLFLHAYRAAATLSKLGAVKSDDWWAKADESSRREEVARCRERVSAARMDRDK